MTIKSTLTRLLPSYRMGKTIRAQNTALQKELLERIDKLDHKLEYLFWLSEAQSDGDVSAAKRRVFSMLPRAQGETRMIQLTNLEILKQLRKVCDENQISFYLIFGNLLGAVRGGGAVPWDDDIDIAMMRKDYLQLLDTLRGHPTLRVVSTYNFLCQKFIKVKFKNSDTFFVDIFVMDVFDADEKTLSLNMKLMRDANRSYSDRIRRWFEETGANRGDFAIPQENAELDQVMKTTEHKLAESLMFCGCGDYVCFGFDTPDFVREEGYVYRKDELFPPVMLNYEGDEYPVFRCYDIWLKNVYGDYWSFPHNMRSGHGDLSTITDEDFQIMQACGAVAQENAETGVKSARRIQAKTIQY